MEFNRLVCEQVIPYIILDAKSNFVATIKATFARVFAPAQLQTVALAA